MMIYLILKLEMPSRYDQLISVFSMDSLCLFYVKNDITELERVKVHILSFK